MQPAGQDPEVPLASGTVAVPLRSQPNASPFWIMLLLVSGRLDNGMIRIWQPDTGVSLDAAVMHNVALGRPLLDSPGEATDGVEPIRSGGSAHCVKFGNWRRLNNLMI
jgi:hypothetical protein